MSNGILNAFDTLKSSLFSGELVEISSNREMTVQGSRGIIEYTDQLVRIGFKTHEVCLYGRNITINCLTNDSLVIRGIFERLEWI